ncbi:MAG: MFS transporter [Chloroflexi bacterium]|nr:MFS transporter [Chloroflexota bacterium]
MPAYTIFLLLESISAFSFPLCFTVYSVYAVTVVQLNPFQLVLVGTVLEATAFLFEIPTGIVADLYSRRASILLGVLITGASFLLLGLVPTFGAIILAQIIWGIGYTFTSGATEAWIADEIGEARANRAYLRASQASQIAGALGVVVSAALANFFALATPIVVSGAMFVALGAFLFVAMPERGFKPAPRADRATWQKIGDTFRDGIAMTRKRPILATIFLIGIIFGAASEGFDRLSDAHILQNFSLPPLGELKPIVWFGILEIAGMLAAALGAEFVRRRVDTHDHARLVRALSFINAAIVAGVIAFALAPNFAFALGAFLLAQGARRMNSPLQTAWVNHGLDPQVRATVISMRSQMDALGQIAGGPIVGVIGNIFSIRAAIAFAGMLLAPALVLYRRTMDERR